MSSKTNQLQVPQYPPEIVTQLQDTLDEHYKTCLQYMAVAAHEHRQQVKHDHVLINNYEVAYQTGLDYDTVRKVLSNLAAANIVDCVVLNHREYWRFEENFYDIDWQYLNILPFEFPADFDNDTPF